MSAKRSVPVKLVSAREALDVPVQAALMEVAFESVAEQRGQGLTVTHAVEQPLGAMDPLGRKVDRKGDAPAARFASSER